ncbi:MAG: hypothetical protein IPO78_16310 [Saprospiraceae bacterium]|nr:hypothetical protein [Saprospiraceae bacterium]
MRNDIGILVQSSGKALLTTNDFDDATDNTRDVQIQLGSVVTLGMEISLEEKVIM